MPRTPNSDATKCPITFGLDIFGDRWTLLIIRDIVFRSKQRYSEFLASYEGISTNILANRLSRLEAHGIVQRRPDPNNGARVRYLLTIKGRDLIPVLLDIIQWSARHDPSADLSKPIIAGADDDLLDRAKADRTALIEELIAALPVE